MNRLRLINTVGDVTPGSVRCTLAVDVEALLAMMRDLPRVDARRPGGRVIAGVETVPETLAHVAVLHRQDPESRAVDQMKQTIQARLDSICRSGSVYPLAGLSPHGAMLLLVFADSPAPIEEPLDP
jgi:hypothetical protein